MSDGERKKGLSSGSSFVDIVTKCYFVDKSLLIKELLDTIIEIYVHMSSNQAVLLAV